MIGGRMTENSSDRPMYVKRLAAQGRQAKHSVRITAMPNDMLQECALDRDLAKPAENRS
jgi:hypothetical protein